MERFETTVRHHAWYEHWHRYHFVKDLVVGKQVADIACGVGYGSALMALSALSVIGVDIDDKTMVSNQSIYKNVSNLSFINANAIKTKFTDNSFDVIVSFETLEHLEEHELLLGEFKRILKGDGILIISTPDKNIYSENDTDHNEYHVKELNSIEFNDLITSHFKYCKNYGQQFNLCSLIESQDEDNNNHNTNIYLKSEDENNLTSNTSEPKYLIKICSNNKQTLNDTKLPNSHRLSEPNNDLYKHYEEQINRLLSVDQQNIELRELVDKQSSIINHMKARLGF